MPRQTPFSSYRNRRRGTGCRHGKELERNCSGPLLSVELAAVASLLDVEQSGELVRSAAARERVVILGAG
eukprot:scaffold62601_cov28-Tisochrysis_lutea.AAC.2